MATRGSARRLVGTVVSDRMQKTVVVRVARRVQHSAYKKYVLAQSKLKAHDERDQYRVGDRVEVVESRPFSRDKRWIVSRLVLGGAREAKRGAAATQGGTNEQTERERP